MILISSIVNDLTTSDVIDWLSFHNNPFLRINREQEYSINFSSNEPIINDNKTQAKVKLSDFSSYWFRRGKILKSIIVVDNNSQVNQAEIINQYFHYLLKGKNTIGEFYTSEPNKLIVLEEAKKTGLNIPVSFVVEKKEDLISLLKGGINLITKTIAGSSMYQFRDGVGLIYTNPVNKELVDKASDEFFPSLIQYEIQKKYELRVFFLEDKFWAMAIFSQKDDQTKGDYRRYNQEKGNRNVPFLLPDDLKEKMYKLMSKLGLNCGSIDLIVSTDNTYYFLEVNPIGQFGNVSHICNFQLEKEVAQKLCEK